MTDYPQYDRYGRTWDDLLVDVETDEIVARWREHARRVRQAKATLVRWSVAGLSMASAYFAGVGVQGLVELMAGR